MFNKCITLAICIVFVVNTVSYAAWTVTDPGSYQYYVQQIEQATEEINKLTQQITELQSIVSETAAIKDNLMGQYNRAVWFIDSLKFKLNRMMNNTTLFDAVLQWVEPGDEDEYYNDDGTVNTEALLQEVFGDPRYDSAEISPSNQYMLRMAALESAITEGEAIVQSIEDRMEEIEQLSEMIDSTANAKDAQDLTNRLLVEILTVLNEHLVLTARIGTAEALQAYKGAADEAHQEIQDQTYEPDSTAEFFEQAAQSAPDDPVSSSFSE